MTEWFCRNRRKRQIDQEFSAQRLLFCVIIFNIWGNLDLEYTSWRDIKLYYVSFSDQKEQRKLKLKIFQAAARMWFNFCPYRTPRVNQYWAIVNASLSCNIFCSLSPLKFAHFNGAKDTLSTVTVAQEEEQISRERENVGSIPVQNFIFALGPSLTNVKSDWTQVWKEKSDMNPSMIQQWWGIEFILARYWNALEVRYWWQNWKIELW